MSEEVELAAGASNLLEHCAGVTEGDRILLIHEEEVHGYSELEAVQVTADCCRQRGAIPQLHYEPFRPESPSITRELQLRMEQSDVVIYFSRLADQLRFQQFPECIKTIVNYAANKQRLGAPFGTADYRAFQTIRRSIDSMIAASEHIVVTCPRGSRFSGSGDPEIGKVGEVFIRRFPMLVFAPVSAQRFSGRVAMPRILVGTSTDFYKPYGLQTREVLFADFEAGRLVRFDGLEEDVARANAHYDYVASRFDIDRNRVFSWHAGVHPANEYRQSAHEDYELWCNSAFGNPRILHFHTCGNISPGQISWNVLDPTIRIDEVTVWMEGKLLLENLDCGSEVAQAYPAVARLFANPLQQCGL